MHSTLNSRILIPRTPNRKLPDCKMQGTLGLLGLEKVEGFRCSGFRASRVGCRDYRHLFKELKHSEDPPLSPPRTSTLRPPTKFGFWFCKYSGSEILTGHPGRRGGRRQVSTVT